MSTGCKPLLTPKSNIIFALFPPLLSLRSHKPIWLGEKPFSSLGYLGLNAWIIVVKFSVMKCLCIKKDANSEFPTHLMEINSDIMRHEFKEKFYFLSTTLTIITVPFHTLFPPKTYFTREKKTVFILTPLYIW